MTETDERTEEQAGDGPESLQLGEGEPLSDEALAMSSRPILQLGWMLDQCVTVLEQAEKKLDAAEREYERATDRQRFRTQGEWEAVIAECAPTLLEARAAAAAAADEVYQQSRAIQESTSVNREPDLSDADAIRASARREFVKEDCLEQPLRVVQAKLQAAIASGDAVALYLHQRYATQRLQEQREADKLENGPRLQIINLVEHMRDRLIDKRPAELSARAKEIRKKAVSFGGRAAPPPAVRGSTYGRM